MMALDSCLIDDNRFSWFKLRMVLHMAARVKDYLSYYHSILLSCRGHRDQYCPSH
jgi:hypothetical protein